MLALAMPAFEITAGDWRNQGDFAVTFLDRYGNEIGQRGIIQRDSVPVDEMPDHVIKAVLATEDRRFFDHFGIDFLGLFRAMSENVRANSRRAGRLDASPSSSPRTCSCPTSAPSSARSRKPSCRCGWRANLSKKEILQLYLDRAYMGGGTFGIAAAADFYFGKSVKDLNLAEAAMLAGLFKAPTKYAPHVNLPAARARANEVLTNMVAGRLHDRGPGAVGAGCIRPTSSTAASARAPDYFLDWAFDEVKQHRRRNRHHSLVARTTIDIEPAEGGRGIASSSTCASTARTTTSPGRDRHASKPTARCAPSSAAATTAPASSTAPPRRCARPARRSSPMSTRRRWRTA